MRHEPRQRLISKLDIFIKSLNEKNINVYLIDIDNSDSLYELLKMNNILEDFNIGGWGEIFWFKNEKLIGYMIKDFNEEIVLQNNEILINQ